jgi:alpha-aminoadipate carrier protein LysW
MTTTTATNIECPVCTAPVTVPEGTRACEVLVCVDCQSELEVTSVQPITVDLAPEVEEDWGE